MPRTPDDLLEAVNKATKRETGKLRVFLGMCPGVGKTYSMLEAARQQAQRGVKVVIGIVVTHGRVETEKLVAGLDVVPLRTVEYKGTSLSEMDLDRILTDKPALVLVDELAHTNAPGSRHEKRYQDVREILAAGIDVYTTLNIQHIESRNDQVAQITGVIVRETVPDSFLELADQIEVVDLPPAELLHRLSEGKVYLGEGADRAARGFFKEEHLIALRELSLRFVAEKVDQDLQSHMTIKGIEGPWNTNERLLVAVSHSPYSARLIRATRRMAYNLEAPWIALHVETKANLSREDLDTLQKNVALARELGAEVVTISAEDVAHAIRQVSHDRNVTQIVMGRPDRRLFQDALTGGTLLDRLVRETSKVDVHVIRAERKPLYRGFAWLRRLRLESKAIAYYNTAWFLFAVSLLARALLPLVGYRALGSLFLLAILFVASVAGAGPILFAAVVAAFVWNFFFIPPVFTFVIGSAEDGMMVISFFVTAVVAGLLTSRVRRNESALETREREARVLYDLVKRMSDERSEAGIASLLSETLERQFGTGSGVLLAGESGQLAERPVAGRPLAEKDFAVARWAFENARSAGWSTPTLSGADCLCIPMKGRSGVVGVVVFSRTDHKSAFSVGTENFVETVIAQTAIALERLRFAGSVSAAKLYEASEKLHQTLLNSVSHELRTPLTALIGSASALQDEKTFADPRARQSMAGEIVGAARRLDRVVENLLDVSRLDKGTLQPRREWFELDELLSLVRSQMAEETKGRLLRITGDTEVLLEGDFRLLEHAISQIVLNAVKYGRPGTDISVTATSEANHLRVVVRDEGPGLAAGSEAQVFEKFYRAPGIPAGGLGLGLSIVKSIVELHGGTVAARNRSDGMGAEFEIVLPLVPPPPELKEVVG